MALPFDPQLIDSLRAKQALLDEKTKARLAQRKEELKIMELTVRRQNQLLQAKKRDLDSRNHEILSSVAKDCEQAARIISSLQGLNADLASSKKAYISVLSQLGKVSEPPQPELKVSRGQLATLEQFMGI